jgi:hypothetical protein
MGIAAPPGTRGEGRRRAVGWSDAPSRGARREVGGWGGVFG